MFHWWLDFNLAEGGLTLNGALPAASPPTVSP
jgi:hypothetical protein